MILPYKRVKQLQELYKEELQALEGIKIERTIQLELEHKMLLDLCIEEPREDR